MRSSTWRLEDLRNVILNLGFVGENLHTRQIFDCKKMFDQYPNASVSMTVTPPEGEPYPGTIERDGDMVIWDVRDSDLVAEGDGEIQLVFTQEPHIARSYNARTHVCRSQVQTGDVPSGLEDFVTRADQLLDQVEDTFPAGGTTGQVLAKKSDADYDTEWVPQGAGGTEDYDELENRPQIGGITLTGNKTLHDLGAASEGDVDAKYTKPAGGIPASDIADGVIPDPEDLIDDTAGEGDTDKVWSADKSHELLTEINSKQDAPETEGTAGQVLTLDSNLDPVWQTPSGGGGTVDSALSVSSTNPVQNKVTTKELYGIIAKKDDEETLGKNLLNVGSKYITDGKYLSSTGSLSNNSSYLVSNYIPVESSTDYAISTGASASSYNAWYTEDFALISTFANNGSTAVVQTSPSTAKYLKVSISKSANAQVEKGSSASAFEAFVTKKVIYDTARANGINNIVHDVYDYEHQVEVSPSSYTPNSYMNANGATYANNSYRYSNKITVSAGELCEFYQNGAQAKARYVTAFNTSDSAVVAKGSNDAIKKYVVPDGIESIIITVASGNEVWTIKRTPQNRVLNSENVNEQVESATVRDNSLFATAGTLANGSKLVCGNNSVSVGKHLSFHGFFESFTGLIVGHGYTSDANSSWVEIDGTKVKVYRSDGATAYLTQEYTHGLTMTNYINVVIIANLVNAVKIIIYTNGGSYTINSVLWFGRKGDIFALANGNDFTSARIGWVTPLSRKKIWAYGDSYFDTTDTKRWPKYLIDLGISSVMWDNYSGRASDKAIESFKNDLKFGTPKFVIWAMGMNDTESSAMNTTWKNCVDEMLALCVEHEIIPILCTIPNTSSRKNTYKNSWVEGSGYRYIDFAKAVGGSSYPSSWYSDMLSTDGVHPDVQGAIALFAQAITDFPELLDDE